MEQPTPADWKPRLTAKTSRSIMEKLRQGEPWLFADGVQNLEALRRQLPEGGWVRMEEGGLALFDPQNPIALRLLDAGRKPLDPRPTVRRRVALAWQIRQPWFKPGHNDALRLLHGEGDRLPGLVADYYAGLLVFRPDCPAWNPYLGQVAGWLEEHLQTAGGRLEAVVVKGKEANHWLLGQPEAGAPRRAFHENGLAFEIEPEAGQKTGFFLDMRPNRAFIGQAAQGLSLLNCFAYTGAFGVYAHRGGAKRVVQVEVSPGALESAKANLKANGFTAQPDELAQADVFDYLEAIPPVQGKENGPFDIILLDPPAFAHNQKQVEGALAAYRKLNGLALTRLGSGQFLATASCSSRVSPQDFMQAVLDGARQAHRRLRLIHSAQAGPDHPVAPDSGIGPYLKFHYFMVE